MRTSSIRSYLTALRASSRFGRALKLQRKGRTQEALRVARGTVYLLRAPHIVRDNPAEASLLLNLTVMIEHLAGELRQPGADLVDLHDSVRFLETLAESKDNTVRERRAEWLPYLQGVLKQRQ